MYVACFELMFVVTIVALQVVTALWWSVLVSDLSTESPLC